MPKALKRSLRNGKKIANKSSQKPLSNQSLIEQKVFKKVSENIPNFKSKSIQAVSKKDNKGQKKIR